MLEDGKVFLCRLVDAHKDVVDVADHSGVVGLQQRYLECLLELQGVVLNGFFAGDAEEAVLVDQPQLILAAVLLHHDVVDGAVVVGDILIGADASFVAFGEQLAEDLAGQLLLVH